MSEDITTLANQLKSFISPHESTDMSWQSALATLTILTMHAQWPQPSVDRQREALEAVRAFWQHHTQSNTDRMNMADMHDEAYELEKRK